MFVLAHLTHLVSKNPKKGGNNLDWSKNQKNQFKKPARVLLALRMRGAARRFFFVYLFFLLRLERLNGHQNARGEFHRVPGKRPPKVPGARTEPQSQKWRFRMHRTQRAKKVTSPGAVRGGLTHTRRYASPIDVCCIYFSLAALPFFYTNLITAHNALLFTRF